MAVICKNNTELTGLSRKATGIQLPVNERVRRRGRIVPVVWGTEPGVAQTLKAKGGAFREPQICETQVPTFRDWKSGTHGFLVLFYFFLSEKTPFNFNLPLEDQHWVLLTNHLLIQQDCEVESCQHIQLQTKAICRGDTKYPGLELNLLAFGGQISSGLQLLNWQSKDRGAI